MSGFGVVHWRRGMGSMLVLDNDAIFVMCGVVGGVQLQSCSALDPLRVGVYAYRDHSSPYQESRRVWPKKAMM